MAAPQADSALARVGTRAISPADYRRSWGDTHPAQEPLPSTPQAARGFLQVLVDRELIRSAAARESWAWTAEDSASYAATRDRAALAAALHRALSEAREPADTAVDERELGVRARARAMERLAPRWDEAALGRIARRFAALPRPVADSSIAAQWRMLSRLPAFDAGDSAAVLARSAMGDYTGADLFGAWAALSPAYRPRVGSADDVRDLVGNGLFERALRQEARARDAGGAEVAVALARERERIAVDHLMARDVHGAIVPDTVAVRRWFAVHAGEFRLPARWRVVRLVLGDRASATSIALVLRDPAAAESLVARGRRQGVGYRTDVAQDRDSLAFARAAAAGAGTVTGPDPEGADWAVMRVEALLPARVLDWNEAGAAAWERWYEERESERLAAVLARERKRSPVAIDERSLRAVVPPVAPTAGHTSGNAGH